MSKYMSKYKEVQNSLQTQGNDPPNYRKNLIGALVVYLIYEILAMATFVSVNSKLGPTSADIIEWTANYSNSCGHLDMTYALQNACLNSCAYFTMPVTMYIITLYRDKTAKCHFKE